MGQLVEIVGVSHSPYLPALFARYPDIDEGTRKCYENFQLVREKLAAARPDVLIAVGSDHLNHFFMDSMPAFVVAKPPVAAGPHPGELSDFTHLPSYRAEVDVELARTLIQGGFERSVDFAYTDEFTIDHSWVLPLHYLRPEQDLPVVPISCNVIAPPIAPAQRFYDVGQAIRAIVEALPADRRVGVVASGHLALDVGGPRMASGSADPNFDRQMMGYVAAGDAATAIREATWERMREIGNVTPGFLNFVLLMGLARGARPSYVDTNFSESHGTTPFMAWDSSALS
ncbi:MAG TPA: 2,3-dihydroxybiphenyl 1,2-dioxygenase [Chloroflexota bacterium]|jgi:protocatechuate 4,5-dioxygenase beta chain